MTETTREARVPQEGDQVKFHSNLPVAHQRGIVLDATVLEVGGRDGLTLKLETHLPGTTGLQSDGSHVLVHGTHSTDVIPNVRPHCEKPKFRAVRHPHDRRTQEELDQLPEPKVPFHQSPDQSNGYWTWE